MEKHSRANRSKADKSYYRTLSGNIMFTVIIVSFIPLIFVAGILFVQFKLPRQNGGTPGRSA